MVVLRALRLTAVALPREPTERRPPRAHASPIANHRPFGADPVIRAGLPIAPLVTEPRHLGREVGCRQDSQFVQSRDEFDLWFKQRVLDISGLDLNNPPEMELPDLLSVYQAKLSLAT